MPQTVALECSLCHHRTTVEVEQSLCAICSGPLLPGPPALHPEIERKPADELRGRLPTSLPVGGIITPQ